MLAGPSADAPPPAPGDQDRTRYDLTLYRLGPGGDLAPVRTLSRDWDPAAKPYAPGPWFTTQPSTRPTAAE